LAGNRPKYTTDYEQHIPSVVLSLKEKDEKDELVMLLWFITDYYELLKRLN
jgi:hypothetical protein